MSLSLIFLFQALLSQKSRKMLIEDKCIYSGTFENGFQFLQKDNKNVHHHQIIFSEQWDSVLEVLESLCI